MALTDNKTLSWNISLKEIGAVIAIFILVVIAIYFEAIVIGYVAMTLALCGFFLAVAFDVGITHHAAREAHAESPADAPRRGGSR